MGVREHLEIMLDVLDGKEWIQDDLYETADGRRGDHLDIPLEDVTGVCLAGAYQYGVLTGTMTAADWEGVSRAVLAAVNTLFPERGGRTIPSFNDHPDTTREDIYLALKTAIENGEER